MNRAHNTWLPTPASSNSGCATTQERSRSQAASVAPPAAASSSKRSATRPWRHCAAPRCTGRRRLAGVPCPSPPPHAASSWPGLPPSTAPPPLHLPANCISPFARAVNACPSTNGPGRRAPGAISVPAGSQRDPTPRGGFARRLQRRPAAARGAPCDWRFQARIELAAVVDDGVQAQPGLAGDLELGKSTRQQVAHLGLPGRQAQAAQCSTAHPTAHLQVMWIPNASCPASAGFRTHARNVKRPRPCVPRAREDLPPAGPGDPLESLHDQAHGIGEFGARRTDGRTPGPSTPARAPSSTAAVPGDATTISVPSFPCRRASGRLARQGQGENGSSCATRPVPRCRTDSASCDKASGNPPARRSAGAA